MDPKGVVIGKAEIELITDAHRKLLTNRADMIRGFSAVIPLPYERAVYVDSMINGLVSHLTEAARQKEIYESRYPIIAARDFRDYVTNLTDDLITALANLPIEAVD